MTVTTINADLAKLCTNELFIYHLKPPKGGTRHSQCGSSKHIVGVTNKGNNLIK
jgi:hypothetical protein